MNLTQLFEKVLLLETKEKLINNNPNLTDDQKKEMNVFFYGDPNDLTKKAHANLDSKIDWSKPKGVYDEFIKIKLNYDKDSYVSDKINTNGYVENEDYIDYGEKNGLHYYIPLTYEVQRDVFQAHCPTRWCIGSAATTGTEWSKYIREDDSIFINIYNSKDSICLQYYNSGVICIWNSQDKSYQFSKVDFFDQLSKGHLDLNTSKQIINTSPIETDSNAKRADQKRFINFLDKNILNKFISNYSTIYKEIIYKMPSIITPKNFINTLSTLDGNWSFDEEKHFAKIIRKGKDKLFIRDMLLNKTSEGAEKFMELVEEKYGFEEDQIYDKIEDPQCIKASLVYRFIYSEEVTPMDVRITLILTKKDSSEKEKISVSYTYNNEELSTTNDLSDLVSEISEFTK